MGFKTFLQEKYYNNHIPPEIQDGVEVQKTIKYDLILFYGDYNPITREEYSRIFEFINDFVPKNKQLFSDKLEVGLLCDYDDDLEQRQIKTQNYDLLLDEMKFLTTKLFGLKLYPIDFRGINELIKLTDTPYEEQLLSDTIKELTDEFKKNFLRDNALVVLRPDDSLKILSEISNLTSCEINIGFMAYQNKFREPSKLLSKLPYDSRMLKLICILDYFRPNPEDLRTFCFRYKLQDLLDEAKRIHFKTGNEYYFDAFKLLFPNLNTSITNDSVNESNVKVIFELLKRMFLKRDIE